MPQYTRENWERHLEQYPHNKELLTAFAWWLRDEEENEILTRAVLWYVDCLLLPWDRGRIKCLDGKVIDLGCSWWREGWYKEPVKNDLPADLWDALEGFFDKEDTRAESGLLPGWKAYRTRWAAVRALLDAWVKVRGTEKVRV